MVYQYRDLRVREGMSFGPELLRKGTLEHAAPLLTMALTLAAAVLPLAMFGARPGHEVLGPLSLVILGGLVTVTLYTLCVVPALYSRFGAGGLSEAVTDEDLGVAV